MPELTIGRVAGAAGVNVETVRYYQRVGLIDEPPRPAQGFRRYPAATVARIRFIKRAQELGFALREIGELLGLDDVACDEARRLAEGKLVLVHERIRDLEHMAARLESMIATCREERDTRGCALIEALSGKQPP